MYYISVIETGLEINIKANKKSDLFLIWINCDHSTGEYGILPWQNSLRLYKNKINVKGMSKTGDNHLLNVA